MMGLSSWQVRTMASTFLIFIELSSFGGDGCFPIFCPYYNGITVYGESGREKTPLQLPAFSLK
jgi:hypothetical protein